MSSRNFYRIKSIGLIALYILTLYFLKSINVQNNHTKRVLELEKYSFKDITSIQYQQIKESYGKGDGKQIMNTNIAYVYPDKMRIENIGETKTVEIYNNDKYIYYDGVGNTIKVKECFPPEKPYVSEIEDRLYKILDSESYEFFGYEEIDNRKAEVIGIESKMDGQSYMRKIWFVEIKDNILPVKEEYFINNSVVSKTTYIYLKINEPINPDIFDKSSLPEVKTVNDGVLPKYVESLQEAQKYLNFKLILPKKMGDEFTLSEISVIPPIEKPSFYCIYIKDGYRIYMGEKLDKVQLKENASLGGYGCEFTKEDEKVIIAWKQNNLYIILSGDEELLKQLVNMAEDMASGKLIVKDKIN